MQLHWLTCPPAPHVFGSVQVPQFRVVPQPSPISPHSAPAIAHVVGVQVPTPQRFGPPAPHVSPLGHTPQLTMFSHPSLVSPQSASRSLHVFGVQTQEPSLRPLASSAESRPASWFGFSGALSLSTPKQLAVNANASAIAPIAARSAIAAGRLIA